MNDEDEVNLNAPDEEYEIGWIDLDQDRPVRLQCIERKWYVVATNQGGYDTTHVDLAKLLDWLSRNQPNLLHSFRVEEP